jgi:hypothetical protein
MFGAYASERSVNYGQEGRLWLLSERQGEQPTRSDPLQPHVSGQARPDRDEGAD